MHAFRCNVADPDVGGMSRWEELKQTLSICIEAHSAVGCACDVYFINRGTFCTAMLRCQNTAMPKESHHYSCKSNELGFMALHSLSSAHRRVPQHHGVRPAQGRFCGAATWRDKPCTRAAADRAGSGSACLLGALGLGASPSRSSCCCCLFPAPHSDAGRTAVRAAAPLSILPHLSKLPIP